MNNYYYILGLVFFLGILYYCFTTSDMVTENFETVAGGTDDTNAINTLAQLAQQLMTSTGAVTVPGSLAIQGGATIGTTFKVTGATALADLAAGATKVSTLAATGNTALTTLGVSGLTTLGNLTITGASNMTGATTVANNLTVTGKLTVLDPDMFKSQVAGYYTIRAGGWKAPLYYGVNMLWNDGDFADRVRAAYGFTTTQVSYANIDCRNANNGDNNWVPRGLVVLPGYKAKIILGKDAVWNGMGKPNYTTGSYNFGTNDFGGYRAHMIIIRGATETDIADSLPSM